MKGSNIKTGICLECKTEFNLKHKDQKFCGKSCTTKYCNRLRPKQEKLVEKDTCKSCGEEFTVVSKNPKYRKKFCNKSCAANFNNKGQPKRVRVFRECKQCKGNIEKRGRITFCSNECKSEHFAVVRSKKVVEGTSRTSTYQKEYLAKTRGEKCEECGLGNEWNGKKLTLQLDHIDGCSDNNKLENLRILCPNCHTQTPTFGSKNSRTTGNNRSKVYKKYLENKKLNE